MKKVSFFLLGAAFLASSLAFVAPKNPKAPITLAVQSDKSRVDFIGSKAGDFHTGTFAVKGGSVQVEGGKLVGGSFEIDMKSIVCDDIKDAEYNGKLVGHLKSDDFFSVDKNPVSKFVITKATVKAGNKYTITGNLTIKGKTKAITFPAYVNVVDGKVAAQATFNVDRSDFDVKFGSASFFDGLGDKVIYDDFNVSLNLVTK